MSSLRMFVASPPSTPRGTGTVRPVMVPSSPDDAEVLASFKRTLLVAALDTSPRFRSDLDLVLIRQHLASLGVFTSVAPHVLHYLATECTLSRIPDGEVLFYQEDLVDDNSLAYIVLEGSLCGYLNKAFSQRKSKGDGFRAWNSKNTNARGVAIDFGDLQVTYGKGAICGIEDFDLALSQLNRKGRHHERLLCRHKSVHSQEPTIVIGIPKDTLKRTAERFGVIYEKGVLTSTKAARSDVAHLAMFSLVSETVAKSMLEGSPKRQLEVGEVLYAPESKLDYSTDTAGFAFVRHGRLDVYCVGNEGTLQQNPADAPDSVGNDGDIPTIPKDSIASLTKGQTFGDQMIALGHPHIWASNPRQRRQVNVQFKIVAGDPSTEVTWITRDQFEYQVREDQLRLAYNPIFAAPYPTNPVAAIASAIESRDICQITRQLLTNATLSKFFFQFPPLVLERLCHHMEIQHHDASAVMLGAGDRIDHVCVVVCGALHSHRLDGETASKASLECKGSAKRLSQSQDIHFIPGDTFGARELLKRNSTCDAPVLTVSGTTVLCITQSTFERWLSPMRHNTIVKAGSILQPLFWNSSLSPANSRPAHANKFTSATKVNRRQSGPSVFSATKATAEPDRKKLHTIDEATILLKRLGLFQSVPRFLLAQILAHASLIAKPAGELLFREGSTERALVVILSGFVSFYSLEYMAATVDMFQKHPFCIYNPFFGSTINPEDYLPEPKAAESEDLPSTMPAKHSSAMHGVHIQTLPSRNAFRTGVLQEGSVCPATVMAQTDCEYLVFEESVYARLLVEHIPAVDMSTYTVPTAASESGNEVISSDTASSPQPPPVSTVKSKEYRPGVIPPPLLTHLEAAQIPWFPQSSAKKALLLRSMHHMILAPGQRLLHYEEIIKQIVFVVSGKLAVYVRESHEVSSILNASQRSVQSAALERSVASNYSTTSQQLYQERIDTIGSTNRNALRRKIARISEVEAVDNHPDQPPSSLNGRFTFTNFVKHAAKEAKARQSEKTDSLPERTQEDEASESTLNTRRSLHAMVNKVSLQRKFGDQNASTTTTAQPKETSKALLLFYLSPGDIYGDEIAAPSGIFRSVHDVYADTSMPNDIGTKDAGLDRPLTSPVGTEILCLDRHVMHAILSKTEVDAANELLGKSSSAKNKWQAASKKLFKQASQSAIGEPGGRKKAPKLFDFFKNIVNQRRFLTMGTITQFPQLRDLPEDARQELCLNARFEALERYTDAYKSSDDGNGASLRFFLVLSGRINLFANGSTSHIAAQGSTTTVSDQYLREVGTGEGFGEFEILMPDSPAHIAAIAVEPTKLLSIPADMFKKHWPFTEEARGNIEYLRTQICFASLDLEQIAYLYHSFSFQTHIRGTNILQLHENKQAVERAKELYLVKEGSCSIRQCITLTSRGNEYINAASGNSNSGQASASVKKPTRSIKVLATVADVNAGHVFWVDNDHYPITLVASSASVTIASISLDRLKAIVPRGLLAGLEELSEQLRDLYAKQLKVAKRAAATVMNERVVAQARVTESPGHLPTLQTRAPQNLRSTAQACGGDDDTVSRLEYENAVRVEKINASYNAVHQIERYDAPSAFPISMLAGSFIGKKEQQNPIFTGDKLSTFMTQRSLKQDECSSPEHTTGNASAQQTPIKSPVHLDVMVPVAGPRPFGHTGQVVSPDSKAASLTQRRCHDSLTKNNIKVDGPASNTREIVSGQDGLTLYEVDVRARVHAQMCTIASPMRTMRLEPSHNGINTLGKFSTDIVSPFAKPGGQYRQQSVQQWQYKPPTVSAKLGARPMKTLSLTENLPLVSMALDLPRPELTRKQGFLTALRVSNAAPRDQRILLDDILPRVHQGRRYFYVLIDDELREYADTIAVNNLAKAQCLRRYNLHTPHRSCIVSDVPVISGEAKALLRQSFLLIVDDTIQFFFTAASAMDKQKWMTELHQASVLGGLQHPLSVKVQSSIVPKRPPPADPAILAAVVIDAFKGSRRSTLTESR